MRTNPWTVIACAAIAVLQNCDKSTPLLELRVGIFETIGHAAIHLQDGSGLAVAADTSMPGPHLNPDSIEHRRIDVTLPIMGNGYGGYIHFGPDITGDMLVCVDVPVRMSVTNRTAQGDTPLAVERTFTEREIADSTNTPFVKNAILFEAKTGGNIIKLGPVAQQMIHAVIEEAEHEHED